MATMTWEEAVEWLRAQPDKTALVEACYYDDPLPDAAKRFWASPEWVAIRDLLFAAGARQGGTALDLGAGRGISCYALWREGFRVTALEPDPSDLVGAGAIRALATETGMDVQIATEFSEDLPFAANSFDVVNCRQVLHHARDLPRTCAEIMRVLKPGGLMIATREHVLSRKSDLGRFLDSHALHRFYGGENAFLLEEYTGAMKDAGLTIEKVLAPLDSAINYFPMTPDQCFVHCTKPVARYLGRPLTNALFSEAHPVGRLLMARLRAEINRRDETPGRLYSFLARKPPEGGATA